MPDRPILIIAGTNRPNSNALRVARQVQRHYERLAVTHALLSLADLPQEVFQPSSYATKPPAMIDIQQRVLDALGLHIVTPEYNGSFPGVLKYFIDMLKFPDSFEAKPVAFIGESAGIWGGLRSVEQLQMIFGYRNAYLFPQRVFIPGITKQFNAAGDFTDAAIDERISTQANHFARFAKCVDASKQT